MDIPKPRSAVPSSMGAGAASLSTSFSSSVYDWRPTAQVAGSLGSSPSSPGMMGSTSFLSSTSTFLSSPSSPSMMANMTSLLSPESISTLPQRLRLASIQRDDSDVCLKILLQRAFYPQTPGAFFSYTVTEEEISLVVDEDTVTAFPPDTLVLSPDHLRAIQVYEGAHAINMTGYVSLLSGGITQEGINVIYFSTFNTDLLLVDEKNLDRALALLKKTLADFNSGAKTKPVPPTRRGERARPLSPPSSSVSKQMLLSPLPKNLSLACMATSSVPSCTHQLLKAFLSETPFFSFTVTPGDELSLILDDELMADFPGDVLTVHSSQWKSVQVDFGSLGFTDMGGVSLLADILAQEGISIYYLSTFSTDFILVEATQVEQTISVVSRRLAQMERSM